MARERIETGIDGLDDLLHGGIPRTNTVLLAGPAGSGKTTFGLEYLYRGAAEYGQQGLYISFEESKDELIDNLPFDWDLRTVIDRGMLEMVKYDPYQYEDIIDMIRTNVKQGDAERVVVDSITALNLYVDNVKDVRKLILDMNEELKKQGATTIYTGEIRSHQPEQISRFGVEAFIADGVITLMLGEEGSELTNQILVRKMRGTDHNRKIHPFDFKADGLKVYAEETSLSSDREDTGDMF
ncbi:MAG: ATPase domain-containing protein [Candidatus Nanohaloarchaea archaeon]|nr:ATPase domain-containing protein [Candidatus Nanohaloarchaea archaeon]